MFRVETLFYIRVETTTSLIHRQTKKRQEKKRKALNQKIINFSTQHYKKRHPHPIFPIKENSIKITFSLTLTLHNLSEPLSQRTGKHTRQLSNISNHQIISEWE